MKSILIGGIEYTIHEVPVVDIDGDRNFQGTCAYRRTEISVIEGLSEQRKTDVLAHEVMHAMFYEAGFEDMDEDTVCRLAKVFRSVLTDNNLSEFRPEITELWAGNELLKVM